MKKTGALLIVFICLFSFDMLLAQKFSFGDVYNRTTFLREMNRSGDVEGSPYVQNDFVPARIANSELIYSVRYNAFTDQMEVVKDDETVALPMISGYSVSFENSNKEYQVFSAEEDVQGFFVVISEGENFKLLNKESVEYKEAVPSNGIKMYEPPTFKRQKDRFYIGYKNNTATRLPSKKKEFYALFGKASKDISSYVKKNKLNIKKEDDLVKIFQYYNSL